MNSQPHADHAAHREPAKMHTVKAKRIQQTEDVMTQLLDGVVGRCNRRLSVPTRVVTQDAETPLQFRHLRIPHEKIGAKRIGKYQHGLLVTSERVMRPQFSDIDKRHCLPFLAMTTNANDWHR